MPRFHYDGDNLSLDLATFVTADCYGNVTEHPINITVEELPHIDSIIVSKAAGPNSVIFNTVLSTRAVSRGNTTIGFKALTNASTGTVTLNIELEDFYNIRKIAMSMPLSIVSSLSKGKYTANLPKKLQYGWNIYDVPTGTSEIVFASNCTLSGDLDKTLWGPENPCNKAPFSNNNDNDLSLFQSLSQIKISEKMPVRFLDPPYPTDKNYYELDFARNRTQDTTFWKALSLLEQDHLLKELVADALLEPRLLYGGDASIMDKLRETVKEIMGADIISYLPSEDTLYKIACDMGAESIKFMQEVQHNAMLDTFSNKDTHRDNMYNRLVLICNGIVEQVQYESEGDHYEPPEPEPAAVETFIARPPRYSVRSEPFTNPDGGFNMMFIILVVAVVFAVLMAYGKTVGGMHTKKYNSSNISEPTERILFTTA